MELLEEILDDKNLFNAYKQVYKNKGTSGVDGITVDELGYYMFMDSEELKRKEKEEGLTEEEKVNLELNPFFVAERPTKDR